MVERLREEAERVEATLAGLSDPQERAQRAYLEQRRLFGKWDAALDITQNGSFWLRDPQIADLVAESLHHRDGQVYDLGAFSIMPNHVHVIYTPLPKSPATVRPMAPMRSACSFSFWSLWISRRS